MTGSRLGGDSSMRNAKGAVGKDAGSDERCEVDWVNVRGIRRFIWIWQCLKRLVGAQTIRDEQDKPLGRRLDSGFPLDAVRPHSVHDRTDKVYIKDRIGIDEVEDHRDGEKPNATETRHDFLPLGGSIERWSGSGGAERRDEKNKNYEDGRK